MVVLCYKSSAIRGWNLLLRSLMSYPCTNQSCCVPTLSFYWVLTSGTFSLLKYYSWQLMCFCPNLISVCLRREVMEKASGTAPSPRGFSWSFGLKASSSTSPQWISRGESCSHFTIKMILFHPMKAFHPFSGHFQWLCGSVKLRSSSTSDTLTASPLLMWFSHDPLTCQRKSKINKHTNSGEAI